MSLRCGDRVSQGENGKDQLFGVAGAHTLEGGAENDQLRGGAEIP